MYHSSRCLISVLRHFSLSLISLVPDFSLCLILLLYSIQDIFCREGRAILLDMLVWAPVTVQGCIREPGSFSDILEQATDGIVRVGSEFYQEIVRKVVGSGIR
jgi:hypothetical protein